MIVPLSCYECNRGASLSGHPTGELHHQQLESKVMSSIYVPGTRAVLSNLPQSVTPANTQK